MKILSGTFGLLILALVLCFALSNLQETSVTLWPLQESLQAPLYAIGLLPLIVGLLLGGLWGWLASMPHRWRARKLNKELNVLNAQIDDLQKSAVIHHAPTAPKKSFWKQRL